MPNNSQFNIEVGTILNTNNVSEQLKKLNAQLQKSTSTKIQYKLDDGQIVTAIKTVNTLKDAFNNLYKQTQITSNGMQLSNKITTVTESFKGVNKELVETSKYTNIVKDKFGNLVTQITSVDENGQRIRTTIKEVDDGLGRLTKTTEVYNETEQKRISQHTESINNQVKYQENLEKEAKAKAEAEEKARKQSEAEKQNTKAKQDNAKASDTNANANKKLGQTFGDIVTKVSKFYIASLPIRMVQTVITEATNSVKEFDKAITEMGKVTDYSGEKLKAYTRDLADMGAEVGRTMTEMTEATTGWLKAGYTEEDSAQLARYSALLQNTADEELSSAEATEILVSQLKAYNMEVDDTIKVTDILNKVSANQAVSSGDIAKGLTLASASMATFGNSIEETTALLTAGTTIFQGKSAQVARGLNMIATRVAKSKDDLEKYGVAIYDASGDLRSTYDILVDLAPAWNRMSKAEQVALGNTLAGY